MNNNQVQLLNAIEKDLNSISGRLEGLPKEQQKRVLHEERDTLMGIVRTMMASRIPLVGGLISGAVTSLMKFFGFDPFEWLYFEEYDHNARFADYAFSDPHLFNALIKAGEIFELTKSKYLNEKTQHFHGEITSTSDANSLAQSIITACKTVTAIYNGQTMALIMNINDVKIMLEDTIKRILDSAKAKQRIQEKQSRPVISAELFAWVKYEFSSDYAIEEGCCTDKKFCDLDLKIKYFCFPSEGDFRAALKETETKMKK